MKKILFLCLSILLLFSVTAIAQPAPAWVRADSVQYSDPYLTYAPYISGGTNHTGEIKLTIYLNGGELKTWGYAILPNTWNNIGQQYDGQLFELDEPSGSIAKAQWIHYFYSTRDMTILANARELQAKILGWAYYDGNNACGPTGCYKGRETYQPLGLPPVLYEGNINDLYGVANAWGGTIFIYSKGDWTYPPRFINGRLERREWAAEIGKVPEMRLLFQAVNGDNTPITFNQVQSVEWLGKGLGTPLLTDTLSQAQVSYNTITRFWNPATSFITTTELQYQWLDMPTDEGPVTFRITLNDGNVLPDLNTNIKSLNDLPAIPAIFNRDTYSIIKENEKKSGKIVVKAELIEETVNNITVREITDPAGGVALVIQWPEPDVALFGGLDMPTEMCGVNTPCAQYQVKVFVGAQRTVNPTSTQVFLWYDVPAQMGTVVVDADTYQTLKTEMLSRGFDLGSLRVIVVYRENYLMPPGSPSIMIPYINRAQSPMVPINTFE